MEGPGPVRFLPLVWVIYLLFLILKRKGLNIVGWHSVSLPVTSQKGAPPHTGLLLDRARGRVTSQSGSKSQEQDRAQNTASGHHSPVSDEDPDRWPILRPVSLQYQIGRASCVRVRRSFFVKLIIPIENGARQVLEECWELLTVSLLHS